MKKSILLLSPVVLFGALSACVALPPSARVSSQPVTNTSLSSSPAPTPTSIPDLPSPRSLKVGEFTFQELNAVGGGGCGMSLWKPTRERVPKLVFFNGLNEGEMWMKIDGKLVKFQRIAASGEEFYGQTIAQTFQNEDKTLRVEVSVALGEKGEIESIAISSATIRIERAGEVIELSPIGDAGC
ncbi:hypothetical protein [Oscillatoria sp. FACHB-1406]|uniref:hypothetical protein n=1 Tax=Oscillatoria sp. FACHB-1406 TaxID=2692846 RepID=UPI0016872994|nr:hypothetical protein [Oscillatoria sp. FACHB-1406]MBD2577348.1 hypothetical protein [Oscillatoria sp. FACHB-1406]